MDLPINAYRGEDNTRIYEYANGRKEKRVGGTRSWRNNNPGNIRYVKRNDWIGQIGKDPDFCMFNNTEKGRRAIKIILKKYANRNLTLGQGIAVYAPAEDNNNVKSYIEDVVRDTGIPAETFLRAVVARFDDIATAITKHEGYKVGEINILEEGGCRCRTENYTIKKMRKD